MANDLTLKWTGLGLLHVHKGDVDYLSDTIKLALLSATPNQDTSEYFDDVSANEVTGTGWSAGGVTLASKTLTYDTASNEVRYDAADISASGVTITGASDAVIYVDTGTPSTSILLAYGTFDTALAATNGDLDITFGATGILKATAAS